MKENKFYKIDKIVSNCVDLVYLKFRSGISKIQKNKQHNDVESFITNFFNNLISSCIIIYKNNIFINICKYYDFELNSDLVKSSVYESLISIVKSEFNDFDFSSFKDLDIIKGNYSKYFIKEFIIKCLNIISIYVCINNNIKSGIILYNSGYFIVDIKKEFDLERYYLIYGNYYLIPYIKNN